MIFLKKHFWKHHIQSLRYSNVYFAWSLRVSSKTKGAYTTFLNKNSVKLTDFVSNLISRNVFQASEFFSTRHSVVKKTREILFHKKNFVKSSIISSLIILVKLLVSRNFCQKRVRENIRKFYSALCTMNNLLQC